MEQGKGSTPGPGADTDDVSQAVDMTPEGQPVGVSDHPAEARAVQPLEGAVELPAALDTTETEPDQGMAGEGSRPSPQSEQENVLLGQIPPAEVSHQETSPVSADKEKAEAALRDEAPPERGTGSELESQSQVEGGELEELTLPPSVQSLDPLPAGIEIGPERLLVESLITQQGRTNRYRATRLGGGAPLSLEVLEAPDDHTGLQRQVEVLTHVQYSMLPRLHGTWEEDSRRYLAIDLLEGPTLENALAGGMTADKLISVGLQLAQALRRLHAAGWAIPGLSPDAVCMGQPIRIADLSTAVRIGETPPYALQIPGYSAPELAYPAPITGKEDVYTLAAILYRGLSGELPPEQGLESVELEGNIRTPGAPQLLAGAIAPPAERIDLEELYRRLLALKRRLSAIPLALRVASGTSVGLNQTRQTNEDACGYLSWSSAYEGHAACNAVLCVVDGMGGMEAGEVASTAALRSVLRKAAMYAADRIDQAEGSDRVRPEDSPAAQLKSGESLDPRRLVEGAAEAVYAAGGGRNLGATITCAVIEEGNLTLGHVGDTRAYLLRDGDLTQITRDHSLVAVMVASGVLTKEEARGHPESNKVLRSLGSQKTLPEGYVDDLAVAYGEPTLHLRPEDQLLLCSDGVWGQLDDDALRRVLAESPDCESAVQTLIHDVLAAGAPDNASVIVARCAPMPAS